MMEVSRSTYKTLRKLIPYGQENIDKQFEFREENSDLSYAISLCRHPRGSLMLRVTEKGLESATHSFFGLAIPQRTNISLWAYSMAIEDIHMPIDNLQDPEVKICNKLWKVSSESDCPQFPNFMAMGMQNWNQGRLARQDELSYGATELSRVAKVLDKLIENGRQL